MNDDLPGKNLPPIVGTLNATVGPDKMQTNKTPFDHKAHAVAALVQVTGESIAQIRDIHGQETANAAVMALRKVLTPKPTGVP